MTSANTEKPAAACSVFIVESVRQTQTKESVEKCRMLSTVSGRWGHGALRANGRVDQVREHEGSFQQEQPENGPPSSRHHPFVPSVLKGLAHLFLNPPLL